MIFVHAFIFISCSQNETPYAEKISYDNYLSVGNTETLMSHERDRNIVYTPQEYVVDNVKDLYKIN